MNIVRDLLRVEVLKKCTQMHEDVATMGAQLHKINMQHLKLPYIRGCIDYQLN